MMTRLVAAVALAALLVPLAAAHGAPAPRGQDSYLLDDHNDDCGGHSAADPDRCNGTHDLIALHIQEAYDASLGDVVRFRFFLNGGTTSDGLRDVLTFKTGSTTRTFELRTSNNVDFQGTGFDRVAKAIPVRFPSGSVDGDRFIVEATVKASALGGVGTKLTDYRLDAYRGPSNARGDYVPGGAFNGLVDNPNPDQGEGATNRVRTTGYVLRGPTYYATVTSPPTTTLALGEAVTVPVRLANDLRSADWDTAQAATLDVKASPGLQATWAGGASSITVDLPAAGSVEVPLTLRSTGAAGAGTVTVTLTTNLGGHSVHTFDAQVQDASSSSSSTSQPPSKGAPGPAPLLALGALAAAFALRRRT